MAEAAEVPAVAEVQTAVAAEANSALLFPMLPKRTVLPTPLTATKAITSTIGRTPARRRSWRPPMKRLSRISARVTTSIDNASVPCFQGDRLYVDFSVEATAVHLQVFMTFTDGEWRISSDADGNVQIFEVTALYNYVG